MKILYVEDNPQDAELARLSLSGALPGHETEIAPTLAAAYARLKEPAGLDLALIDLHLPDGNGLELLAHIRERKLPLAVAILTGSGDQQAAAEALRNGADDYIVKRHDYLLNLPRHLESVLQRYREEAVRKSQPLRVFYAEHSAFDIDLTRQHLARYAPHIRIETALDSDKVLDRLSDAEQARSVCDVLLLDYNLSGFNAIDIAKILRYHRNIDIPIVMVTGQGNEEIAMQAMRLGFYGYQIKQPGYLYQLPALLEGAYYRSKLAREHAALKESRQQFMELVTRIPVGVYRLHLQGNGAVAFEYASPRFREIFRLPPESRLEEIGSVFAWAHPEDLPELMALMEGPTLDALNWEGRFVIGGEIRWIHFEASATALDNGDVAHNGIAMDVTERRLAEETLRQSATVFENTRDGIAITDPTPTILAINRAFTTTTGYNEEEVLGRNPSFLKSGRHERSFYQALWATLKTDGHWQGEIWNRRKNGEVYPEWLSISAVHNDKGEITHYVSVFTDITQLRRTEEDLERLSHYDPLTGLPNRLLFQTLLEHSLERMARHDEKLAVLLIDLDHFKNINDSLGHPAGDELLAKVAERIQRRLRGEDTMARLGGDEFVVLMEWVADSQEVAVLARDILTALTLPFPMSSGHQVYVGGSIGIVLYPDDAKTAVDLIRNVETAMYQAKGNGRNQFSFYTRNMNADALARLDLEAALRGAIERDELVLHYQPKVDLRSGRINGAEALIRWQRQNIGLISPLQFIPLAEKSDLIIAIGSWVIQAACRQIRNWCDAGQRDIKIAVNVSARQFHSGNLEYVISQALDKYGLEPGHLELELTESMLMEHPDETVQMLQRLKQIGIKISLDDFGTGYSSLAYLSRFPIDTLKIDQSFVKNLLTEKTSATIAASIIGLAHSMELDVVAEGVETPEQLNYLRSNGCDVMQGFYFSKPLPAAEFAKLLEGGKILEMPKDGGN
ncbi:MAG: EAL domain-containing protein [Sulfuricella sp.]|nr:EAL domain-containing protein [Sulfuricella sp.]